jgi:putative ATPase
MRPERIEEIFGQDHILGPSGALRRSLETGNLFSIIFWGPPGSGKTTIARLIAKYSSCPFESFSAVLSGVKELRGVIASAKKTYKYELRPTILFVDEIHRFNKAQQDAFLPHVESGLNRALKDKKVGLGDLNIEIQKNALQYIINISHGDARIALNNLESASYFVQPDKSNKRILNTATVAVALNKKPLIYDKDGEEHYNIISALHKSMRGSDPQASIYWLYRMLEAGEDPLFIGRRLIRFASEDIGLANPKALEIALTAYQAWERVGPPEAELSLLQAVIYLATAPKSNSLYMAEKSVKKEIEKSGPQPVPLHLRNAPTKLMREMGYGKGYIYPHGYPYNRIRQEYLPEKIRGRIFYRPSDNAFEKEIKRRMADKKKPEDSNK